MRRLFLILTLLLALSPFAVSAYHDDPPGPVDDDVASITTSGSYTIVTVVGFVPRQDADAYCDAWGGANTVLVQSRSYIENSGEFAGETMTRIVCD